MRTTSTSTPATQVTAWWSTLVVFSRPHTIVGTVVAVVVLHLLATRSLDLPLGAGAGQFALVLVAAVATNLYIVGVNQVTDVEIDRINKPWLPLAAGTMSMPIGRAVVGGSAVLAVVLGAVAGPWMLGAAVIGIAVGSAYSLPPLRFKRSHVLAAASITSVRALVVNLFVFAHFHRVLGGSGPIPPQVWVLTGMVVGLTVAIAWFKDLPDAEGDATHHIATLVLTMGPRRVLAVGLTVLGACFLAVAIVGVRGLAGMSGPVLVLGHLLLLAAMLTMGRRVDLVDHGSVRRFYTGIWRLFVAEYLVFAAAALAA